MNFLLFGAGAIGTYIGGSLTRQNHRVVFLEQADVAHRLRERGLRLQFTSDDLSVLPPTSFTVCSSLAEALGQAPFDAAIFALKSFDTAAALEQMRPYAASLPPVLSLSNGVDNESALASLLGQERVIAGVVTSAVGRRAPGDVILERRRGIGIATTHPVAQRLLAAFRAAGLNARPYANAAAMKWSKMITNLLANATSAILDMTPAEIFAHPALYRLEIAMLREALAVMQALKLPVVNLPKTPVRLLAWAVRLPEGLARPLLRRSVGSGRGGKMPSFHIDLHSGRGRLEVEWLNGAVARYGEKVGVNTPVNRFLTDILLALTRGELPRHTYARQPEKLLAHLSSTL